MGAASQGKGLRHGRWHLVSQSAPWTPPARAPGSCRRKERSKPICVLVTMANMGNRRNSTKQSWRWTRKHTVQVRLGVCTRT